MADFNSILVGAAALAAASCAVAIVLPLMLRTVRSDAVEGEGTHVLKYGHPMKGLVIVLWVGVIGFFVAALFAPAKDRVPGFVVVVLLLLMLLPLHLEMFGVRVEFDAEGLRTRSPWRSRRDIPWSAINRVWFSQTLQWYVVQTFGFGHVRLPLFLSGVESLLNELEARGVPVARRPLHSHE